MDADSTGMKMKKKSPKVVQFIEGLHGFLTLHKGYLSSNIETREAIGRLIVKYLEDYFSEAGFKDVISKAHDAFYWQGRQLHYDNDQSPVFGERKYPDFIIDEPYFIAIIYKEGTDGSAFKEGIGESLIYTLSGRFDFVYYLFQDKSEDGKIHRSVDYKLENSILAEMWDHYNVCIKLV